MVTVRDAQSPCHNVNHLEEGTADFTITPIFFTPALSQIFGTWPNRMLGFCEPGSLLTPIFFILDHVWSFIIIIIIIYTGPKMMFGQVWINIFIIPVQLGLSFINPNPFFIGFQLPRLE